MKINTAKQKMLRGELALGYSAKLGSPIAAEFLGHSGVDFVVLDSQSQHGAWGPDALGIIAVCVRPDYALRPRLNSFTLIG
jgi:2-keto-3-deoxy-L-rhamnonate aldolase RhmA